MAQFPGIYTPRYSDSIAELLARQGDIAARGAEQQGALWANAISQLGQIGAGAVEAHQERKTKSRRDAALMEFVDSGIWAKDPQAAIKGAVAILGPSGLDFAKGLMDAAQMQQSETPEDAMKFLPGVAGAMLSAPASSRPLLWGRTRNLLLTAKIAKPEDLPETWNEEQMLPVVKAYAPQAKPVEPKVVGKALVTPEGKVIYQEKAEPKAPQTQNIGGRVMQFNPESGRFDVDLGASEGSLTRAAAEIARGEARTERETTRAEKQAEKEKEAAEAARATDDQIRSAFGAMKSALGEVKRLSGTKALTSPLEAANARQQYDDAAKAFAATLSRATGDSRISDLDRKAYASLLTYQGIGSGALKIMRPDLVEERLTKAETIFSDAAKERKNRPSGETPERPWTDMVGGKIRELP